MTTPVTGRVYLVGGGPGAADLLTLRAVRILQRADVVLYDRLVSDEQLALAPQAEKIYVGKDLGKNSQERQDSIHRLLIHHARSGRTVVRLKGGDPFVFGRGSEEGLVLSEAGIPWELVPGISSSIAAPGIARIPVTHRGVSAAYAVFSGQSAFSPSADVDWLVAARIPTAIFLMGVRKLPDITRELLAHGRSSDTPIAVIEKATTPQQRVVTGTLDTIVELAKGISSPATIVVGSVVALREELLSVIATPAVATFAPVAPESVYASHISGLASPEAGSPHPF